MWHLTHRMITINRWLVDSDKSCEYEVEDSLINDVEWMELISNRSMKLKRTKTSTASKKTLAEILAVDWNGFHQRWGHHGHSTYKQTNRLTSQFQRFFFQSVLLGILMNDQSSRSFSRRLFLMLSFIRFVSVVEPGEIQAPCHVWEGDSPNK